MFGIVQGGAYKDLRTESAKIIGALPFFGVGIGGSLGKTKKKCARFWTGLSPCCPKKSRGIFWASEK